MSRITSVYGYSITQTLILYFSVLLVFKHMQMVQYDFVDYRRLFRKMYPLLSGVRWCRDEEVYMICYARNSDMQRCRYPLGLGFPTMWNVHLLSGLTMSP